MGERQYTAAVRGGLGDIVAASTPAVDRVTQGRCFAGPYLAIVGRCSMQGAGTATGYSLSCDDAPVRSTDVGLAFGGGLAFPLAGKVDGMVQARYDLGLKTVEASLRTRALMLFAGISIPLRLHGRGSVVRTR